MGYTGNGREARTYLADDTVETQVLAVAEALSRRGSLASGKPVAVVSADGSRVELPPVLRGALLQLVEALSQGMGVRVSPLNAMLTTQEAADLLGCSRQNVVAMMDRGEVPSQRPNRHRYVRLGDLVAYQERARCARSEALARMAREAHEHDLYTVVDTPEAPATRQPATWAG